MPSANPRRPATVYMLSRRTERRVHLFRPDTVMNQIFLFCLGLALKKIGASLVCAVLMSNHYHAIIVDHFGRITELTEYMNLLLTKATQVHRGWLGKVFNASKPSYVELLTPLAVVNRCGYVLANPSAAGLVRFSKEWPGVRTRVGDIGEGVMTVKRPSLLFDDEGEVAEEVEIRTELPDIVVQMFGVKQARERIADSVAAHEEKAHAVAAEKGWAFKGAERVLRGSPFSRAKTLEVLGELNPRYAGDAESIHGAVMRDRAFRVAYRAARERWLAGERDVVWPFGTDALRRRYAVPCAPS